LLDVGRRRVHNDLVCYELFGGGAVVGAVMIEITNVRCSRSVSAARTMTSVQGQLLVSILISYKSLLHIRYKGRSVRDS
jgi:uncharacterized membrane protein YdcZ (DUF606 family)